MKWLVQAVCLFYKKKRDTALTVPLADR